jgi:hypothetical protein
VKRGEVLRYIKDNPGVRYNDMVDFLVECLREGVEAAVLDLENAGKIEIIDDGVLKVKEAVA